MLRPSIALFAASVWLAGFAPGYASSVNLELITVGDPGNPDNTNGYGAVPYTFAIGKYEVTLDQYASFLNAVAATDTHSLWYSLMGSDANVAGITRSGISGGYTYAVVGDGTRPVSRVSWMDAARFVNWLHNGQPTGAQTAATTEDGAYPLNGALSGPLSKHGSALYWIPTRDEWDKAAFYQPAVAGGDTDGYWNYATASNTKPNSRNGSTTDANSANYFSNDSVANGVNDGYAVTGTTAYSSAQNYLTPVGSFTQASSYYGTYDQSGNVAEWTDAGGGITQLYRGGHWSDNAEYELSSSGGHLLGMASDSQLIGFRVASVPEPGTGVSLLGGIMLLVGWRRWRR